MLLIIILPSFLHFNSSKCLIYFVVYKCDALNKNYKTYTKIIQRSFVIVSGKKSNLFPTTTTSFGTRCTSQVSITNSLLCLKICISETMTTKISELLQFKTAVIYTVGLKQN